VRVSSGLEPFFTLPGLVLPPPPVWKMAALTWLAIYPLVTTLLYLLGPHLEALPLWGRTLVLTGCMVPVMSYVVMPWLTRRFRRWLFPSEPA